MRIRFYRIPRLFSAALTTLLLAANVIAADKTPKVMNVQGRVEMFDRNANSITVQTKGGVQRKVIYGSDTKCMGTARTLSPAPQTR
jgi:hypothetical protein